MPGPQHAAASELLHVVESAEKDGNCADLSRVKLLCKALLQPSANLGSDADSRGAAAACLWEHGQSVLRQSSIGTAQPTLAALLHLQLENSTKGDNASDEPNTDQRQQHAAAQICQQAWELMLVADQSDGIHSSSASNSAAVMRLGSCLALGRFWLSLDQLEQAEVCLSQGGAYLHTLQNSLQQGLAATQPAGDVTRAAGSEACLTLVFDVLLLRTMVLWRLQQHIMAQQLITDCLALLRAHMPPTMATAGNTCSPWLRVALSAELLEVLLVLAARSLTDLIELDVATVTTSGEFGRIGMLLSSHKKQTGASAASMHAGLPNRALDSHGKANSGVTEAVLQMLELGYEALTHAEEYARAVRTANSHQPQDEDDAEYVSSSMEAIRALRVLRVRLACWMAYCHYITGSARKASSCLDSLEALARAAPHQEEKLGAGAANTADNELQGLINHPAVTRLRLRVLLQCGRIQEAETELLALTSDGAAQPAVCMEEIQHVMNLPTEATEGPAEGGIDTASRARGSSRATVTSAGLSLQSLLQSVQVLLQRCNVPTKAVVTARFLLTATEAGYDTPHMDLLLTSLLVLDHSKPVCNAAALIEYFTTSAAVGVVSDDTKAVDEQHHSSWHMEAGDTEKAGQQPDAVGQVTASKATAQRVCQQLLRQQGVHHYEAHQLPQAVRLLEASLLYAKGQDAVQLCKVLALACMAQHQMDRALLHLHHAEQIINSANDAAAAHTEQCQMAANGEFQVSQDEEQKLQQSGRPPAQVALGVAALRLPVSIPFLQLKIRLVQHDVDAALTQLGRLPECEGYTPALMEVVCQEASRAKAYLVAAEALAGLHTRLVQGTAPASAVEADVIRCQIRCVELHFIQQDVLPEPQACTVANEPATACMAGEDRAHGAQTERTAAYMRLAGLFSTVHKRLDTVGFTAFFGLSTSDQAASAGLEWFASTGTRLAAAAGMAGCAEAAAVLHFSVASMLAAHPAPSVATYRLRRMAAVLTTTCVLTVACETPSKRAASCQLGRKMMALCQELAPLCLTAPDAQDTQQAKAHALLTYYELLSCLLMHEQDLLQQLLACKLSSVPHSQQPSGDQLVQLASMSKRESWPAATTRTLLQLALQRLAYEQPANCDLIVKVLRALVELSSSDAVRLATYKEAAQLLQQLASASKTKATPPCASESSMVMATEGDDPADVAAYNVVCADDVHRAGKLSSKVCGVRDQEEEEACAHSFPAAEVEWLLATCWNRAAHHTRLLQLKTAADFMKAALQLLAFAPKAYQQAHRGMMQQQLKQVEQQTA